MTSYFITPGDCDTVEDEEKLMFSHKARLCMAHQGWLFGGDPLKDFAAPGSLVYLRREVIAWVRAHNNGYDFLFSNLINC